MRKPAFCICENKDADQLRGNREADQRLCFRYIDSTIPLLPKSEISSLQPSSVVVQTGLCRTWSETPKTGFLTSRLIYHDIEQFVKNNQGCPNYIYMKLTDLIATLNTLNVTCICHLNVNSCCAFQTVLLEGL